MTTQSIFRRYQTTLTFGGSDYSLMATILIGFVLSLIVWGLTRDQFPFPTQISDRFYLAEGINQAESWLEIHIKGYTRAVSAAVGTVLEALEAFLWFKPWPIVILAITLPALAYGGLRLALFTLCGSMFWGFMQMWDPAMSTLALMVVSVAISVVLGIALGVASAQSDRFEAILRPVLDTMQTMPAFVYLIPAIFFFGASAPSAAMAVIIYAVPPAVRLTNLGIRQVPASTIEAARAFGSTRWQMLFKVQLPQAMPSIMLGVNQTIMMALGLAVLAVFIGAGGLGEEVWKAIRKLKVGWSLEAGLCIVFMAIIFDRVTLAMSKPASSGMAMANKTRTFRLLPQAWVHSKPAIWVEDGVELVWNSVAAAARLLVDAIALPVGAFLGVVHKGTAENLIEWMRNHRTFVTGATIILAVYLWDAWVSPIGSFPRAWHFTLRGPVDDAVDWLTVSPTFIGITKGIRAFIYLYVLNPLDKFLVGLPWFYVMAIMFLIVWRSAGLAFAVTTVAALTFTALSGLWAITMYTMASTIAAVVVCIMIGLPLGVAAAYNRPLDAILRPILDTMQTMPTFVYLIPALMFFGGNPVTAIIATVIYAVPPMIRMTTLGLRQLPPEINEVANAFGSTGLQSLIKVKLPMASPSIILGVNQAVVMALAMQVITPLVGGLGLGKEVFHAMNLANTGKGLVAGIGIVLLAIVLDRLTQAWTRNQRQALGL